MHCILEFPSLNTFTNGSIHLDHRIATPPYPLTFCKNEIFISSIDGFTGSAVFLTLHLIAIIHGRITSVLGEVVYLFCYDDGGENVQ
jgi:hypothetical protein